MFIKDETNISSALKATLELLIGVCMLLAEKHLGRNSKNSSLPPVYSRHAASKAVSYPAL
ncbi:MAG: hypothetical protein LBQ54_15695 [Planctomycetaceae bacterium]|nr:hypothetical protein [Planctomycetaceae bacterium]